VDASVIATAERLGTLRILTLDERDFRAVRSQSGQPFVLLPADATS
jgi:predicted nucleic acid-binding protein